MMWVRMPNSDDSRGSSPDASWDRDILAALAVVVFLLLTVLFALYLVREAGFFSGPSCGFGCPGPHRLAALRGRELDPVMFLAPWLVCALLAWCMWWYWQRQKRK